MLLVLAVAVVAAALNPAEGVNLADLMAVGLTAIGLVLPLLAWAKGSAALTTRPIAPAAGDTERGHRDVVGAWEGLAVPRQLPAAVAGFAGRTDELAQLMSLLEQPPAGGTVVISAVDGTAGIGKTALAVRWAHQVAPRFPDGQLYVNLRGFDPAGPPMTPAEAMRGFLDAFQVPAERIPLGMDAQASLYRSILAGRRVLVVLDNARDATQVRSLLPGSPGCVVVVTSRTRLSSLIAVEGARSLTVNLLSETEARELLVRRLGASRVAAEPKSVLEIITRCARLPLALSIVAARATMNPGFPLAVMAAELRQARGGLQAFHGGEVNIDVGAVFSWSYRRLDPMAARLFRLLGLHSGPDITAAAAASLAGWDLVQTRQTLAELAGCHLVAEQVPGRFGFHDLLRAYAAELVGAYDTEAERRVVRQRMLDHYLHTAHAANLLLHPVNDPIAIAAALPGVVAEEITNSAAALAWFEAEYAVLLAAIQLAADTSNRSHAWQLPHKLTEFCSRRGRWADWAAITRIALDVTQCHGDWRGLAHSHQCLGTALNMLGQHDKARDHLRRAVELFAELSDPAGQADSYRWISHVHGEQGNAIEGLVHAQRALDLARTAGSPRVLGLSLNSVGWFHALLGEPEHALTHYRQALALNREIGDRLIQAHTLNGLGYAHLLLGQYQRAIDHLQQATTIKRELGIRYELAADLNHLGDAHHAAGDHDAARDAWQQSLHILEQLSLARAGIGPGFVDEINAKLRRIDTSNNRCAAHASESERYVARASWHTAATTAKDQDQP